MTSVGCCRLDYASNADSLSAAAASLVAEDYPMSWLPSRRLRPAPWDCCCWTNSSTDKRNLFRDYISTSGGESSLNLRGRKRKGSEEKYHLGEDDWKKLLFLLQIGFEIDISLSDVETQDGKVLWRFYCFWSFFFRSLWLSTLLGDCFESFSDELLSRLKAFGGNFLMSFIWIHLDIQNPLRFKYYFCKVSSLNEQIIVL